MKPSFKGRCKVILPSIARHVSKGLYIFSVSTQMSTTESSCTRNTSSLCWGSSLPLSVECFSFVRVGLWLSASHRSCYCTVGLRSLGKWLQTTGCAGKRIMNGAPTCPSLFLLSKSSLSSCFIILHSFASPPKQKTNPVTQEFEPSPPKLLGKQPW